jgi:lipopolysaccharide export system protein LptA
MTPQRSPDLHRALFVTLAALLLPVCASALPEDAEQKIDVAYDTTELFLDEGLVVYTGSAGKPACINQGTLQICGNEIRLERAEDGSLNRVTATGMPARYQQQPAADKELVHASGNTLIFDNVAQLVTADGAAEFSQAGNVITSQHIEYDLKGRVARAAKSTNGEQGTMTIDRGAVGN